MLKKRLLALAAVLILALTLPASADTDISLYPYCEQFSVASSGAYYIDLNPGLLEASRDDLADLRLFGPENTEVPYGLVFYDSALNTVHPTTIASDTMEDSRNQVIILDSGDDHLTHNALNLHISSAEGEACDIRIEGGYNDSTFEALALSRIYPRSGKTVEDMISYPNKSYRFLRLTISGSDAGSCILESAEYLYRPIQNQSMAMLNVQIKGNIVDQQTGNSLLLLDLGVKNLTVHKIMFQTEAVNFSRLVNIYESNDQQNWNPVVTESRIYDYRKNDYVNRQDFVEIGSSADRYLKLEIINDDQAPLKISDINVLGVGPRIKAELHSGTYRLYFGNQQAVKPQYSVAVADTTSDGNAVILPVVSPGPPAPNPAYNPPHDQAGKSATNGIIINVVLLACFLAVSALLGRNIWRSLRLRSRRR